MQMYVLGVVWYFLTEYYIPREDREKVRQIVWEYILQGILTIGLNEVNPNFPFVRVTARALSTLS